MTLFLTRYFLRELSAWVLFTPLGFSIALLLGAGTGETIYFTWIMVMLSCIVVFSQYFETKKNYLTFLHTAPLPGKTVIHTDFAFMGWIAFCYASYALVVSALLALLFNKELLVPTIHEISFLTGCCLFITILSRFLFLQRWIPIRIFSFSLYFLPKVFPINKVVPFANTYGLMFLGLILVITSISYFSMIMFDNRRWAFK